MEVVQVGKTDESESMRETMMIQCVGGPADGERFQIDRTMWTLRVPGPFEANPSTDVPRVGEYQVRHPAASEGDNGVVLFDWKGWVGG